MICETGKMKIVKKIFLCAVSVPVLMFAESGTVVKKWETVRAKDVVGSVGALYRRVL
mgnify:CR=1 FL=1